ncbi:ABC transporter [Methylobacterium indicum]|uniref:ABC transporter ATP-binding protein n=1 Tax=Methylobacterium indicum TaxID=1775910 RepID=UPI000734671B|nr:sn-glycerol-3-phosphate ABC transporter ATP-binding protein UgpC [Methylobacterium indicum]KTS37217.1 ABC transporter [Methylobacterium indicum]KTS37550.1 ABC transporter [Methylobacterium indicum]KTS54484.1 ABC transporter [Methylobacterium indicum]
MATLRLRGLRKSYGDAEIIKGVDLDIADREFAVFVGPSGCGKSTLLRMIAGLEEITDGDLFIDGQRINEVGPADRGLAMVFQSYALYPHMSVRDNMAFALKLAGASKAERAAKVAEASRILQLDAYLDRKPKDLSGGQRQRVAIGRAIVRHPKIFLFDEPLSNLDAALRGQMRIELARLHRDLEATMIYVTHDQVEAMTMADKIVVLNAGRIEQVGSPLELYHHPANLFVAGFIGSPRMNLLPVRATGPDPAGVRVVLPGGGEVVVPVDGARAAPGATVTLGIRPEALKPGTDGALAGEVAHVERLGGLTLAHVTVAGGTTVVAQIEGSAPVRTGETIQLTIDPGATHLFDGDGRALPHRSRHPLAA